MNHQAKMDQKEKPNFMFRVHEDNGALMPGRLIPSNSMLELAPKVYEPRIFEDGMTKKLGLFEIEAVKPPNKIYGDVHRHVTRYFRTYERLKTNVGVMLLGQKGSGKTTTARCAIQTALQLGMPIIMVNTLIPGDALVYLMESIEQNCVVIFDEYDKTYGKTKTSEEDCHKVEHEDQNQILRILDGSVGGGKKLFFIIGNDPAKISEFLINRPSRVRYTQTFSLLPLEVLLPYVKDNLKDCTEIQLLHFKKYRELSCGVLNFDMMAALVDEMNHFPITLFEAVVEMFSQIKLNNNITYLAEVKQADGTTLDLEAAEVNVRGSWEIRVYKDIGPFHVDAVVLTDEHFRGFKSFGEGALYELLYEKDGVSYTLYEETATDSPKTGKKDGFFNLGISEVGERLGVVRRERHQREEAERDRVAEQRRLDKEKAGDTSSDAEYAGRGNWSRRTPYVVEETIETAKGGIFPVSVRYNVNPPDEPASDTIEF